MKLAAPQKKDKVAARILAATLISMIVRPQRFSVSCTEGPSARA